MSLGNDFSELLSPLLSVTEKHLHGGLALFERSGQPGAFDAVLAAAALGAGAEALVSADRAFAAVTALQDVIPDDHGVTALLSS